LYISGLMEKIEDLLFGMPTYVLNIGRGLIIRGLYT
jgi:hypothetical protein